MDTCLGRPAAVPKLAAGSMNDVQAAAVDDTSVNYNVEHSAVQQEVFDEVDSQQNRNLE
jgi:hypothetical protein